MKIAPLILPAIALALAVFWVADQRRSISTLEDASASLQKNLVIFRSSSPATDPPPTKPTAQAIATKGKESLAWEKIAVEFMEMKSGDSGAYSMTEMRLLTRLSNLSQTLSQEELVTALDELPALDCSADKRAQLRYYLFMSLVRKNPKLAATRYMEPLHDESGRLPFQFPFAVQVWARKDPGEAIAWCDQQITAGKFDSKSLDGKSTTRNEFEEALIQALLGKDPTTISRRLATMTPDQRAEVLGGWSSDDLTKENYASYATLVRSQVPEKEQLDILARHTGLIISLAEKEGYAEVLDFMDRIAATPAERVACAEEAAEDTIKRKACSGKITRTDLDAIREWTQAQAPDSTDRVTGKAIADSIDYGGKFTFADAAELALHYHQASGNDDVLTSFLVALPGGENTEQARALALKINDSKRREEILKKLR